MDQFAALLAKRTAGRGELTRLSRASGIPIQMLLRWRRGENHPTRESLERLAPHLNYNENDLLKMCGYAAGGPPDRAPLDPDLSDVIQVWPNLSEERRAIIRLLTSSSPELNQNYVGQEWASQPLALTA